MAAKKHSTSDILALLAAILTVERKSSVAPVTFAAAYLTVSRLGYVK